ncbi:hypothetical protein LTR95_009030 [Oleoguttula sp. CCFEE 5521]
MASNSPNEPINRAIDQLPYVSASSYSLAASASAATRSTYLDYRSQALPSRPSTQSSQLQGSQPVATTQQPNAFPQTTNVLLVVVAGRPRSDLKTYIETALQRDNSIRSIVILGNEEQQAGLKLLKMDMYALLGRIGREASIEVVLRRHWTSEDVCQKLTWSLGHSDDHNTMRKELSGVVCDLGQTGLDAADLLELNSNVFEGAWKDSVGFVHAVAHGVVSAPGSSNIHGHGQPAPDVYGRRQRPFLAVTMPSTSDAKADFYETAVRSLLDHLEQARSDAPLDIGYADQILIPEPIVEPTSKPPLLAPTDGWNDDDGGLSGGESPTKLWAAASEMGYF